MDQTSFCPFHLKLVASPAAAVPAEAAVSAEAADPVELAVSAPHPANTVSTMATAISIASIFFIIVPSFPVAVSRSLVVWK